MNEQSPSSTMCRFRYRGYRQKDGVREFTFEDVGAEKTTRSVVVDVDIQVLLKHHVHFQDAPRLFLKLLSGKPLTANAPGGPSARIVVSDDDLTDLLEKTERALVARQSRKV